MLSSRNNGKWGGLLMALSTILILFIGIIGVIPAKDISLSLGKQLLAEWAILAFLAIFYFKNPWLRLFFLWNLAMTVHNYNKFSFMTLYTVFIYLFLYHLIVERIRTEQIRTILNGICLIVFVQMFWMGLQYFEMDPLFESRSYITGMTRPLTGFLLNRNVAGSFLAISLPAFFRKGWYWFIPLVAFTLFKTGSLSAILPMAIGVCFYIFIRFPGRKQLLWQVALPILVILGVYILRFEGGWEIFKHGSGRVPLWITTFKEFISLKPLVGWGLGGYKILYPTINQFFLNAGTNFVRAHNELIQLLVEVGPMGVILIGGYFIHLLLRFVKKINPLTTLLATMVIVIVTNANAHFLMHSIVGLEVVIVLALLERMVRNDYTLYRV